MEEQPALASAVILLHEQAAPDYFSSSDTVIAGWFDHFSMAGGWLAGAGAALVGARPLADGAGGGRGGVRGA